MAPLKAGSAAPCRASEACNSGSPRSGKLLPEEALAVREEDVDLATGEVDAIDFAGDEGVDPTSRTSGCSDILSCHPPQSYGGGRMTWLRRAAPCSLLPIPQPPLRLRLPLERLHRWQGEISHLGSHPYQTPAQGNSPVKAQDHMHRQAWLQLLKFCPTHPYVWATVHLCVAGSPGLLA